jgi:hypothetical protein
MLHATGWIMRRSVNWIAAAVLLMGVCPVRSEAESTASSCADCTTSNAEFTIKNNTSFTIHYKVKWGEKGDWKNANEITLPAGLTETHSHALDGNRKAPPPYIRVDADVTAGVDFRETELKFGAVDHVGFPKPGHQGEPVHYFFFVDHGKTLALARE